MADAVRRLCTFFVEDRYLGVDVADVQEVLRAQPLTDVPLAPPVVRGLMNLRGQIVVAVDLRRRLGLPPLHEAEATDVVVRHGEDAVSLLVDEIGDVVEVDPATREDVPPTVRPPARDLFSATYKLPDRLLLVLDVRAVVDVHRPIPTAGAAA